MASLHDLTAPSALLVVLFFLLAGGLAPLQVQVRAQQPYGTETNDCLKQHNSSGMLGYFCGAGGAAPSCQAFLTFTARAPYSNLTSIAALLGADAASLAAANDAAGNAAAAAPLAEGTTVLVPVACACTATPEGSFYQRNATYVAKAGDMLLTIAMAVFQSATTCQALQAQAMRGAPANSLDAGQTLFPVPLRCACPSAAQAAAGARFLVSYLVAGGDDVSAVAARFGVDAAAVMAANELQSSSTIYPNTTLLIPVAAQPNASRIQAPPSPPPPPPVVAPAPGKKGGSHAGVYIGVAVAVVAVAAIASAGAFLALKARRRRARAGAAAVMAPAGKGKGTHATPSSGFTGAGGEFSLSTSDAFSSISMADIKSSLKVYTYAELMAATEDFGEGSRIGGSGSSVYRAAFDGDAAAVEVVDRNVAAEVEIMRRINHLNLIRLIGLCHHRGRWYLVTEYADHGALRDRLLLAGAEAPPALTWAQRVRVALDVAEGLQYLHEYARPRCVHMGVSSGSVLLAGDGPRAKLRSFGAARAITGGGGGDTGKEEEEALFMTSRIAGTRGYMAPEYLEHGVVSPKADVYSLGVVLLELVTGKDAEELVGDGVGDPFAALRELAEELDGGGGGVLQRLEELVDPAMPAGSCPQDAVVMMVRLIERCLRRDAAGRPSTGEVAQQFLKLSGVSAVSRPGAPAVEKA